MPLHNVNSFLAITKRKKRRGGGRKKGKGDGGGRIPLFSRLLFPGERRGIEGKKGGEERNDYPQALPFSTSKIASTAEKEREKKKRGGGKREIRIAAACRRAFGCPDGKGKKKKKRHMNMVDARSSAWERKREGGKRKKGGKESGAPPRRLVDQGRERKGGGEGGGSAFLRCLAVLEGRWGGGVQTFSKAANGGEKGRKKARCTSPRPEGKKEEDKEADLHRSTTGGKEREVARLSFPFIFFYKKKGGRLHHFLSHKTQKSPWGGGGGGKPNPPSRCRFRSGQKYQSGHVAWGGGGGSGGRGCDSLAVLISDI